MALASVEFQAWNDEFVDRDPRDFLNRVYRTFGDGVTLASSFGAEDMILIHLAAEVAPGAEVFCLDTGLLFPETYALIDAVRERYPIRFRAVKPRLTPDQQAEEFGDALWARKPDTCCQLRKVEPLLRALDGKAAWITGVRREQSPTRANANLVEWDAAHDLVKINPLAHWTEAEVWGFIHAHGVLYNPLHDRNYPSIGCLPCTRPVKPGESSRAGRWAGFEKTECGLHVSES